MDKKIEGLGNVPAIFMPSLKYLTLNLYPRSNSLLPMLLPWLLNGVVGNNKVTWILSAYFSLMN